MPFEVIASRFALCALRFALSIYTGIPRMNPELT
jgi:hypothetical protein